MANIGAYSRHKMLEELNSPLYAATKGGDTYFLTPAEQKAEVLANITEGQAVSNRLTPTTGGTTVLRDTRFDGTNFISIFDLTAFSLGNGGDGVALGIGASVFTVSAGAAIQTLGASLSGTFSSSGAYTNAMDVGIGTVIASGAVSVLGGTATFENVMGGVASAVLPNAAAVNITGLGLVGTAGLSGAAMVGLLATNQLFLNAAATWTDIAAAAPVLFTGVISVQWRPLLT